MAISFMGLEKFKLTQKFKMVAQNENTILSTNSGSVWGCMPLVGMARSQNFWFKQTTNMTFKMTTSSESTGGKHKTGTREKQSTGHSQNTQNVQGT